MFPTIPICRFYSEVTQIEEIQQRLARISVVGAAQERDKDLFPVAGDLGCWLTRALFVAVSWFGVGGA